MGAPWSATAYPIWALVSGYCQADRSLKRLVFLQAYIDESEAQQGDKTICLAGYVLQADRWAAFSDDWKTVLDADPSIPHFHMVNWVDLGGQERVDALAAVVKRHTPLSVACSVSTVDFKQIFVPALNSVTTNPNPYFPCFLGLVLRLVQWLGKYGVTIPVDFILDEHQNEILETEAIQWYHVAKARAKVTLPPNVAALFGSTPIFRDDEKMNPLQAADMLAWHLRRRSEDRFAHENRTVMNSLLSKTHLDFRLTSSQLREMADAIVFSVSSRQI
jgi:hypothetical protein